MTGQFDSSYYEDLRGRVRGVLIAVSDMFPSQQVQLLDELIDANESGVALEMLAEMLVEVGAALDGELVRQIERLAHDMGLSPEIGAGLKESGPS